MKYINNIINLYKEYKSMNSIIQLKVYEQLKQKIIDFDIDFDELCSLLINNNAFISGSFLLQVIQNRYFEGETYDIDIYTFGDKNIILEKGIETLLTNAVYKKKPFNDNQNKNNIENENKADNFNNLNEDNTYSNESNKLNDLNKHNINFNELSDELDSESNESDDSESNSSDNYKKIESDDCIKNEAYETNKYNKYNIESCVISVDIINKYKGINRCIKNKLQSGYGFDKIINIVDFECKNNILLKHQLIYYDDTLYKTSNDIINNFDFVFCANYFDGKNIYIKNYNSILSASCTINLKEPRIYNNLNKRIIKYINRGYCICAKYIDDIYNISYLKLDIDKKLKASLTNLSDTENLIITCEYGIKEITNYLNNLPSKLEKLIIYSYPVSSLINNLPILLQELRLYIWRISYGTESDTKITKKDRRNKIIKTIREQNQIIEKQFEMEYTDRINKTINNMKKIPFNCKIYINNEQIEIPIN